MTMTIVTGCVHGVRIEQRGKFYRECFYSQQCTGDCDSHFDDNEHFDDDDGDNKHFDDHDVDDNENFPP